MNMYKDSTTIIPYDNIDIEIRQLVRGINSIDGIETDECCFGHYKRPCLIWAKAESIEAMTSFLYKYFDCERQWRVCFDLSDVHKDWKDIHFYIDSMTAEPKIVHKMIADLTSRFYKTESENEE